MSTRDANTLTDREVLVSPGTAVQFLWQALVGPGGPFDRAERFLTSLVAIVSAGRSASASSPA